MQSTQPKVAEFLGRRLGGGVSGAHAVAAAQQCAPAFRANVVKALAPLVTDLPVSRAAIEATLTDWERLVAQSALDKAEKVVQAV